MRVQQPAPRTAATLAAGSPLLTVPPQHTGADDAVEADAEILQPDDAALAHEEFGTSGSVPDVTIDPGGMLRRADDD